MKIYCKLFFTTIISCLLTISSFAQVKQLSLEEAIAIALKTNYNILLSKNDSALFALDNSYANNVFFSSIKCNCRICFKQQ